MLVSIFVETPRTSHDFVRAVSVVRGPVVCCQIVPCAEYVVLPSTRSRRWQRVVEDVQAASMHEQCLAGRGPTPHSMETATTPATVGEGFEKHVKQARRSDRGRLLQATTVGRSGGPAAGQGLEWGIGGGGSWARTWALKHGLILANLLVRAFRRMGLKGDLNAEFR